MDRRVSAFVLGAAIVLAASGISRAQATDQHGRSHELFGPPGELTVIEFAASWCKPCLKSLPRFEEVARQYPELRFLVVSVDENVERRDELVETLELTIPVIWDFDYSIMEQLKPRGMPATMVLDSDGNMIYGHVGESDAGWELFVEFLEKAKDLEEHVLPGPAHEGHDHEASQK